MFVALKLTLFGGGISPAVSGTHATRPQINCHLFVINRAESNGAKLRLEQKRPVLKYAFWYSVMCGGGGAKTFACLGNWGAMSDQSQHNCWSDCSTGVQVQKPSVYTIVSAS